MRGFYVLENGNGHIWLSLKRSKPPKRPPEIEGQWTPVVEKSIAKTGTNHGTQPWLEPLNQWKRWLQKIKYLWTIASQFCSGRTWCFLRQFFVGCPISIPSETAWSASYCNKQVKVSPNQPMKLPRNHPAFWPLLLSERLAHLNLKSSRSKMPSQKLWRCVEFFLSNEKWGFRVWIWLEKVSKLVQRLGGKGTLVT